jgi:murein DD-endopeptidase MepM/ murein hydrolase activator NlpD
MTTPHRDLALVDPWQRSLDRSLHRRAITPEIRRSLARRKRASVALSTLMVAGPTGSLLAAAGFGIGSRGVDVAQASPASRAIDNGAAPAMAFKLGSRGDAVSEIQRQLGVPVDGHFGPVTQAAVTDFQSRNDLDVDGVVGPATWTALFGLEQAAAAAGARDGNVAVILRERTGASSSSRTDTSADGDSAPRAGADAEALGGDGSGAPGGDTGDRATQDVSADSDDDSSQGIGGNTPVSNGTPNTDATPRTKPVSAPAPANGACGPLRLASPVKGTVTSPYGPRWGRNHDGLDIAAPSGTPIRAAECGIVSFAGVQSGYGNMVCVKHSSRFETCYAHMTKYAVSQGQRVDQGQVIGYVGCTGNCTGPHLHFETRVDGAARDPRAYLGGGSVPGAPTVKAAVNSKTKAVAAAAIAKDVKQARFAKTTTAAQPQATTGWSTVESQQPAASTGAPAATPAPPAASPAPVATTPVPEQVTTAPSPEPVAAPAPTTAPTPAPTSAEPAPVAPVEPGPPAYTPPEPTYTAPEPVTSAPVPATPAPPPAPEPPPAPVAQTPTPAPVAEATPPPAEPAPVTTTPDPTATAPPVEAPPVEPVPAPTPEPAAPTPDPATQPITEAPAP